MDGKLVQNIEKLCATTLFPSHLFIQFRLLICLLCAKCYVGGLRLKKHNRIPNIKKHVLSPILSAYHSAY